MKWFVLSDVYDDERRTLTVADRIKVPWPFPIYWGLHGSVARVFGRPVFGGKKKWWVMKTYRIFCAISNAKYWVKYRTFPTRYHWVNTGLYPGYHDPDKLMLHAAFACLGRYITEAGGVAELRSSIKVFREPDAAPDEDQRKHMKMQADIEDEAIVLWQWWTEEKPADEAERDRLLHILFGNKRSYSMPTDNPNLVEVKFKPFEGNEIELHQQFRALEKKIDDDEQAMLHRLIDIRRSLWT